MMTQKQADGLGDLGIPQDAFAEQPPSWAADPFNGDGAAQCGLCGAWCESVRPGKSQCIVCWDGRNDTIIGKLKALGIGTEQP